MIRPLRRGHLWLVAVVAVIVAPLYLAALAARPEPAVEEGLPVGLLEPTAALAGPGVELPTTPPLRVQPAAAGTIQAEADGSLEGADLLLYWAPAGAAPGLADAYLLGAVRGGERQLFALPDGRAGEPGVLLLYSLGHGEQVAAVPWPPSAEGAP